MARIVQHDACWVQGTWFRYDDLPDLLRATAARHARRAVDNFTASDPYEQVLAAIQVGSAVELIAKSYLASVHPTMVASRSPGDETLLHLSNNGDRSKVPPTEIRTRSGEEALKLVHRLEPSAQVLTSGDIVFRVRNAAVHMGLVSDLELSQAIPTMVRIVEAVLALDHTSDREVFWETSRVPLVDHLLDEATTRLSQLVDAKIAAARRKLDAQIGGLDETTRTVVLASLSGRPVPWYTRPEHAEQRGCPACGHPGQLIFDVERGSLEHEEDSDGDVRVWVDRTAHPWTFLCPVCQLALDPIELEPVGMGGVVELEADEDPYEANEWEPDEGYYRDR